MSLITPSIIQLIVAGGNTTEFDNANGGGTITLSDHSRSPLSVSYDVLSKSERMADGTLKRYIVSRKKIIKCEWSMLPTIRGQVADGNADARDMKDYYESNLFKTMSMTLSYNRNDAERSGGAYKETLSVYWDSLTFDVVKRYKNFDYWNLSAEFVEV